MTLLLCKAIPIIGTDLENERKMGTSALHVHTKNCVACYLNSESHRFPIEIDIQPY